MSFANQIIHRIQPFSMTALGDWTLNLALLLVGDRNKGLSTGTVGLERALGLVWEAGSLNKMDVPILIKNL